MQVEFSRREIMVAAEGLPCCGGVQRTLMVTYFFQSVSAGCWIGTDDFEFRADERLSGDEVAQAVFTLSGGVAGHRCGHVGDFCIQYDALRPAVLQLHARPGMDRTGLPPRMYYRL